ncbi:MAG: hypothetical protein P4M00_19330 [Azospirillaceae bacterium]|nr:hypothetical protein [Azospirillaceae bacterium]
MRVNIVIFGIGVLIAAPTWAQDVSYHCPAPGTVIETSRGGRMTFGDSDGLLCTIVTRNGKTFHEFAGLVGRQGKIWKQNSEAVAALWPLRAGNSANVQVEQDNIVLSYRYEVRGPERLTVPAGTFDTWVIDKTLVTTAMGYRPFHDHDTFWWSPAVGFVIRFEHEQANQTPENHSWEATSVKQP